MSNWNMPPGVSTNDIPGNEPASRTDRAWEHDTQHEYDPDPDCAACRAQWDYFTEAQKIIEGTSSLIPVKQHLVACFARIEELENEVQLFKLTISGLRTR